MVKRDAKQVLVCLVSFFARSLPGSFSILQIVEKLTFSICLSMSRIPYFVNASSGVMLRMRSMRFWKQLISCLVASDVVARTVEL